MNHSTRKTPEQILSVGITLPDYGFGWGLDKASALLALAELQESMIPILGGDVLTLKNGRWEHTYDNWYCNIEPNESEEDYCVRSNYVARKYIQKYPTKEGFEFVFVIVTPDGG